MRIATFARLAALAFLFASFEANAAGALATGKCGAFGYAYDDVSVEAAALRARAQCKGRDCKVIARFAKTCAAFAIDAKNACGPSGWAQAARRDEAQSVASEQCRRYGGRNCVIRAWVCDQRG